MDAKPDSRTVSAKVTADLKSELGKKFPAQLARIDRGIDQAASFWRGSDGDFTLHEDDGLSYGYESGQYAEIDLSWNDASKTLKIGPRAGTFPGMLEKRSFHAVLVSRGKPAGYSPEMMPGRDQGYDGSATEIRF